MGFVWEPLDASSHTGQVIDRERGERLTSKHPLNHWHMLPWRFVRVEDLEGRWRFDLVYKTIQTPTANPAKHDSETVIVQWKRAYDAPYPDGDYLERIGAYLTSHLGQFSEIDRYWWRIAPELEAEFLAHVPG